MKGSKTIQSKAEGKIRGDSTPGTVTNKFDDNGPMTGIAPLNKESILVFKWSDDCTRSNFKRLI
jgi:hypothetical protein